MSTCQRLPVAEIRHAKKEHRLEQDATAYSAKFDELVAPDEATFSISHSFRCRLNGDKHEPARC